MPETIGSKRRYQVILDRITAKLPDLKSVTVKAANADEVKKIRKAVWKEKDLYEGRDLLPCGCFQCKGEGAPIKEKYRLTCQIDGLLMTFKLKFNQSSIHNL